MCILFYFTAIKHECLIITELPGEFFNVIVLLTIICTYEKDVRRRGVVGRILAHPGGPVSIPGGCRNYNFSSVTGCVSFVRILTCVVSGGDPDIVATTHSGRSAPRILHVSDRRRVL